MLPSDCFRFCVTLALLGLQAAPRLAAAHAGHDHDHEHGEAGQQHHQSANLAVRVSASFPQSEIFGVKLVNGHPTQVLLSFTNEEPDPITVAFIGGSLWGSEPKSKDETNVIVRNVTSTRYNVQIPAGEKESISYSFSTEMHPQDLRLNLVAVLSKDKGATYSVSAYNETVSIVEPDASMFEPQLIFLYLLLAAIFCGSSYFIYNTWIAALFPQKPRRSGERIKRAPGSAKKADMGDVNMVAGSGGPAVATGAKVYDESWIPEHHIHRPEAKRVKTGGGRPKSRAKSD